MMKRAIYTLGLAGALALIGAGWLAGPAAGGEGQGPAEPGATVAGLNIGAHWYGAEIETNDLEGKVVLVEIWGS